MATWNVEGVREVSKYGNRAVSTNLYFPEKNFRILRMRKFFGSDEERPQPSQPQPSWRGSGKIFLPSAKCAGGLASYGLVGGVGASQKVDGVWSLHFKLGFESRVAFLFLSFLGAWCVVVV